MNTNRIGNLHEVMHQAAWDSATVVPEGDIRALKHRIHELECELLGYKTTPPAAQPAPVQKKSQQFTSEMNYSNNFKQGERNFCPRCGKRAGDYIHTCTPPQEQK